MRMMAVAVRIMNATEGKLQTLSIQQAEEYMYIESLATAYVTFCHFDSQG